MLKRKYRLNAGSKISNPSSYKSESFLLKLSKNNLSYNRYAFRVSKRISKLAVKRNRIRRILSACIAETSNKIPVGYDMLVITKKDISDQDKKSLALEVESIFSKQNIKK